MPAGYSGTPLIKKLGIKEEFKIFLINPPEIFMKLLGKLPQGAIILKDFAENTDYIHLFTKKLDELIYYFPLIKKNMSSSGLSWISWPKKASKVPTEVDEALVRKTGLKTGLVDIKICAVDDIWSGLKFVYRREDR